MKRAIFNSLGSNYSTGFIRQARRLLWRPWLWSNQDTKEELVNTLGSMYGGMVATFYKGRNGITAALETFGIGKGDGVLTQAFTCWAVEEGIKESGAIPVFVDVAPNSINMNMADVTQRFKNSKTKNRIKAVLVQHTLGYPADIKNIKRFCEKNNLVLIEDLAHAAGADGVGQLADAVVLSFGRDKIIDGVSGGAVINKKSDITSKNSQEKYEQKLSAVSHWQTMMDLKYPLITRTIRNTYWFGWGKLFHWVLKKIGYMTSPIYSRVITIKDLSGAHAGLTLSSLRELKSNVTRRRKIVSIYYKELRRWSPQELVDWKKSSCLRYPVKVKNRNELIGALRKEKVYVGDIWYKRAVDEGSSKKRKSSYKDGSCPRAEELSANVINLPTHMQVTGVMAKKIAKIVRTYV